MSNLKIIVVFGFSLVLSGCTFKNPVDPFEGLNRGVFLINRAADRVVLRPVARIYQTVIPCFVQNRINSFFQNLGELPTIGNDLLQGDFCSAYNDISRFVLNSTVGLGGLFDLAEKTGRPRHYADFGQTLGRWGYKDSIYIMLPLLGPSTVRDTIGRAGTYYMSVWPYLKPERLNYTLYGINLVDTRASYLRIEPIIECATIDEYIFLRDAYFQRRQVEINVPGADVITDTNSLQGPPE